jgi:membrane protease subunit (stomatin/prohibitin family)
MGLLRTAARTAVISGTATAVSGRVARRQMSQAQAAAAPAPAPAPAAAAPAAPAAPAADDSTAKLQELANLHAQGVLTAEEFAAAKAKILGI